MTDRSADVHELLKLANEAVSDYAAIGYLIRAVEALAVGLEDHGHPYAACFGPGGQWDTTTGPVAAKVRGDD